MKPQTLAAIMKAILILLCFLVLLGCNQDETNLSEFEVSNGGYDYPSGAVDSGFFFHPLSNKFSKRDSFLFAWDFGQFLTAFDESNLSIISRPTPELRLAWEGGSLDTIRPVVIVVRKNEIELKEGLSGYIYAIEDTMRLSESERFQLRLLENFFPLNSPEYQPWRRRYLDSIINKNPELASPAFYMALKKKSAVRLKPFKYKSTRILLDDRNYIEILRMINSSGFWSMPYFLDCPSFATDPGGFIFEANTPRKYSMVWGIDCQGDTSKFRKACQKIVELAGMKDKINLIWH